ncbi:type II and III secretion system protein family protein [Rhizobium sp. AB2/73]|uniref:type II and III secretion system protein family protein n=1 Tax=Rhizobium TaxID=379 RepID=UPI000DD846D6|nr:type II and III secretion system protein family protein [Rhizobium sp. AB2/73]QYA13338.1 type II and III secretion system protein family protein [Rhizobium sp. AB2/73]UEQ80729.1 type II and III secretion system protein family protein [Rhizobium sp. AB2/73]
MLKTSKKASLPLAVSLSFSVAFAGLPLANVPAFLRTPTAFAGGSDSIVTIAGLGTKRTLKLGLNKALVVDLPADAHDILVSDPKMADAVTRTSRRIYLFGKTVGQTNIFIFGADGKEIVSLDLQIERDIAGLQDNIKRFIPDSDINVEIISDNIVLTGIVRTPQDSIRAQQLAQAFLKGGEATTRNQTASGSGDNNAVAIFAEGRQTSQIVNMLQIEGEDQVTLKVTVAEIKRSVLKQIGFDNLVSNSSGLGVAQLGNIGNSGTTNFLGVNGDPTNATGAGGISTLFKYALGKYNISTYLNALEQAGAVRTLAEPTLTAISGQAATFNSGGQTLYSTTDKDGNTTITPYTYGITLAFTPVVLAGGRISLHVQTQVSEPVASSSTPTYNQRAANTSVELPSGGSIALAGLLSDNVQQTTSGTPGASKIPILGALFRQKSFQRDESELVIIATPYLVRPVARDKLARPDDNFSPTNDAGVFFMNRVNKIYGRKDGPPVADADFHGTVGFIYK